MSVAENVGFGLRRSSMSSDEKRRAVGEALEMVGLGQFGARAAHALSGGSAAAGGAGPRADPQAQGSAAG